jgi:hypothetical protein
LEEAKAFAKAKGIEFIELPSKTSTPAVEEATSIPAASSSSSQMGAAVLFGGEELLFENTFPQTNSTGDPPSPFSSKQIAALSNISNATFGLTKEPRVLNTSSL